MCKHLCKFLKAQFGKILEIMNDISVASILHLCKGCSL